MNNDNPTSIDEVLHLLAEERSARLTAVAEAEQQRGLKDSLEEAVRWRDSILSVVAHELRNPLNVISSRPTHCFRSSPMPPLVGP